MFKLKLDTDALVVGGIAVVTLGVTACAFTAIAKKVKRQAKVAEKCEETLHSTQRESFKEGDGFHINPEGQLCAIRNIN